MDGKEHAGSTILCRADARAAPRAGDDAEDSKKKKKGKKTANAEGGSDKNEREQVDETKVFVMNLPFDVKSEDLSAHISSACEVVGVELNMDRRNRRCNGTAVAEFGSADSAKQAIESLNGADFGGRPLRMREYYV